MTMEYHSRKYMQTLNIHVRIKFICQHFVKYMGEAKNIYRSNQSHFQAGQTEGKNVSSDWLIIMTTKLISQSELTISASV